MTFDLGGHPRDPLTPAVGPRARRRAVQRRGRRTASRWTASGRCGSARTRKWPGSPASTFWAPASIDPRARADPSARRRTRCARRRRRRGASLDDVGVVGPEDADGPQRSSRASRDLAKGGDDLADLPATAGSLSSRLPTRPPLEARRRRRRAGRGRGSARRRPGVRLREVLHVAAEPGDHVHGVPCVEEPAGERLENGHGSMTPGTRTTPGSSAARAAGWQRSGSPGLSTPRTWYHPAHA